MITVGVDLAAEPTRTAVAVIDWRRGAAELLRIVCPADDARVRAEIAQADKAGIDCPVGWPSAFVALVAAHHDHRLTPPPDSGRSWRRQLTLRATDLDVHARTGLTPLSVSADLIAHVALRWAAIAAQLEADGVDCARDGSGRVVEVYPSASLKIWGLPHRGYKQAHRLASLGDLVDALITAAPWLDLAGDEARIRQSDDCFDAVIAALAARDASLHPSVIPAGAPSGTEGWVHLPEVGLAELVD